MTQSPTIEMRQGIAASIAQFMAAFSRGDAAGVAAVYTEDGQVLPPNGDIVSGRPAIQTLWQGAMDTGVQAVTLDTIEVDGDGPTAYEVGTYTLQSVGGQVLDMGKYLVIWKHEAGQWQLHRDIWNSSRPVGGQ